MNIIKIAGKYLDQPLLVAKFQKKVPYLLIAGGGAIVAYSVKGNQDKEEKKKEFRRSALTVFFTILSAIAAPKIANKIFSKKELSITDIKNENKDLIDNFLRKNR